MHFSHSFFSTVVTQVSPNQSPSLLLTKVPRVGEELPFLIIFNWFNFLQSRLHTTWQLEGQEINLCQQPILHSLHCETGLLPQYITFNIIQYYYQLDPGDKERMNGCLTCFSLWFFLLDCNWISSPPPKVLILFSSLFQSWDQTSYKDTHNQIGNFS